MDGDAGEIWQHPASVHGVFTATGSQVVESGLVGAGNMNPPEFPGDASSGFIEVRDRRVLKPDPRLVEETRQLACCPR